MKLLAQCTSGTSPVILDESDGIGKSATNHTRNLDLIREEEGEIASGHFTKQGKGYIH